MLSALHSHSVNLLDLLLQANNKKNKSNLFITVLEDIFDVNDVHHHVIKPVK